MSRCDYDTTFYRVFLVTLLAIAFSFTVILTNVFVDIDGLINKKVNSLTISDKPRDETSTDAYNYESSDESKDAYRTKRSIDKIETQNTLVNPKTSKIKTFIASRLENLLEELDAQDSSKTTKPSSKETNKELKERKDKDTDAVIEKKASINKDSYIQMLLNNILLQGIIGRMHMKDVKERIQVLMDLLTPKDKKSNLPPGNKNVLVKTVVDIKSTDNNKKEESTPHSSETVKGVVDLEYNGKKVELTQDIDSEINIQIPSKPTPSLNIVQSNNVKFNNNADPASINKAETTIIQEPELYFDQFIEGYFKYLGKDINKINDRFNSKRLKRHLKIMYKNKSNEESHGKTRKKRRQKPKDDELFVEIETHFDKKGMKGERKKKLINNLVEKIQAALHSDTNVKNDNNKDSNAKERLMQHIKKRVQTPLEYKDYSKLMNKLSLPLSRITDTKYNYKDDPQTLADKIQYVVDTSGESWRKLNVGPGFLSTSKAINSAEMSEVNVDYSRLPEVAERIQIPIDNDNEVTTSKPNVFFDLRNMEFLVNDGDGSEFTVGYNQYIDQPPDPNSLKLFTKVNELLKEYHNRFDDFAETASADYNAYEPEETTVNSETYTDDHSINKRSVNNNRDDHSNEYRMFYKKNFLPYKHYRDVYQTKKIKTKYTEEQNMNLFPLLNDDKLFDRELNPAEILGLANLFVRSKRSMKIPKISIIKNKKMNRFLNTKTKKKSKLYMNQSNKKRTKREISKIRIIASDRHHARGHESNRDSNENVFVLSNENLFSDRDDTRRPEPEQEPQPEEQQQENEAPYKTEDDLQSTYFTKILNSQLRHSPLMSKYPHILMEELNQANIDEIDETPVYQSPISGSIIQHLHTHKKVKKETHPEPEPEPAPTTVAEPPLNQMNNNFVQPNSYKINIKVQPKNLTGISPGFKEIHTSINKRFNQNGLVYSTLVNVSEISNVFKINETNGLDNLYGTHLRSENDPFMGFILKNQQDKTEILLRAHQQRIKEQLAKLNREKYALEHLLKDESITETPNYNFLLSNIMAEKSNNLRKDDIENMLKYEIKHNTKSITTPPSPTTSTTTTTTTPTPTPTTPNPTTTTASPTTETKTVRTIFQQRDYINGRILKSIRRNQNLTDQILKKLDRNTDILQLFLEKIANNIQANNNAAQNVAQNMPPAFSTEIDPRNFDKSNVYNWKKNVLQYAPNIQLRNDSNIAIPFVYAYQHPIRHKNVPMASVVYHGHIHTIANFNHKAKFNPPQKNYKKIDNIPLVPNFDKNWTRFFFDENDNGEVVRVPVKDNPNTALMNGNNTTTQ